MNKFMKRFTAGTLLCTLLAYTSPVLAYTKDETVYSKINGNGDRTKTIVTDHLSGEEELVNDLTDLLNIKNVSGDEEFSKDGNKITWKTNGNDVYYQGETEKELPVECNIKYELDGNEMSKEDITGKSGKVKITIQYTNKEEQGIHARPAYFLIQEARTYESRITLRVKGKEADASNIIAVMALDVVCGQREEVEICGTDEGVAYRGMKKFFEENL